MDFDKIEQIREQYRKSLFGENSHFVGKDIQNKRRIQIEDVEAFFRDYQPESVNASPTPTPEVAPPLNPVIQDIAPQLDAVLWEAAVQESPIHPNTTILSVAVLSKHPPKRADEESKKRKPKELLVIIILIFVILLAIGSSILTSSGLLDLGWYKEFAHILFGDVFGG